MLVLHDKFSEPLFGTWRSHDKWRFWQGGFTVSKEVVIGINWGKILRRFTRKTSIFQISTGTWRPTTRRHFYESRNLREEIVLHPREQISGTPVDKIKLLNMDCIVEILARRVVSWKFSQCNPKRVARERSKYFSTSIIRSRALEALETCKYPFTCSSIKICEFSFPTITNESINPN